MPEVKDFCLNVSADAPENWGVKTLTALSWFSHVVLNMRC